MNPKPARRHAEHEAGAAQVCNPKLYVLNLHAEPKPLHPEPETATLNPTLLTPNSKPKTPLQTHIEALRKDRRNMDEEEALGGIRRAKLAHGVRSNSDLCTLNAER